MCLVCMLVTNRSRRSGTPSLISSLVYSCVRLGFDTMHWDFKGFVHGCRYCRNLSEATVPWSGNWRDLTQKRAVVCGDGAWGTAKKKGRQNYRSSSGNMEAYVAILEGVKKPVRFRKFHFMDQKSASRWRELNILTRSAPDDWHRNWVCERHPMALTTSSKTLVMRNSVVLPKRKPYRWHVPLCRGTGKPTLHSSDMWHAGDT